MFSKSKNNHSELMAITNIKFKLLQLSRNFKQKTNQEGENWDLRY